MFFLLCTTALWRRCQRTGVLFTDTIQKQKPTNKSDQPPPRPRTACTSLNHVFSPAQLRIPLHGVNVEEHGATGVRHICSVNSSAPATS
uniref:Secreted protein n=1 Tax=Oryzias melastigma TaxID=30732 RepID=A0A3B3CEG6_ORYME